MKSLLIFCFCLYIVSCQDIVWYISPGGSTDISSCGHSIDNPCAALDLVLDNSSLFIPSQSGGCYQSEETDGRLSTTVYFMAGDHYVPPVCLSQWSDLAIIGLGNPGIRSTISTSLGIVIFSNCTNITVQGVRFISSIVGKASIYAVDTSKLTILDCSIPLYATGSNGIWLYNAYGNVSIVNTRFYGNPILIYGANLKPSTALLISQGEPGSLGLMVLSITRDFIPANVLVDNCTFEKLIGNQLESSASDSYTTSSSISQAVRIAFGDYSVDNVVLFQNCIFQNVTSIAGSAVLIRLSEDAQKNSVSLTHCTFTDNLSRYGGGLTVYLLNRASNNTINVMNSTFINNEATFEGGGISLVSLVFEPTNNLFIGNCYFLSNKAIYGAGVFIFNDPNWYSFVLPSSYIAPPLTDVEITNSHFEGNTAEITEGIINTLRARLALKGNNILVGNSGSSIVLRSSIMVASDNLNISYNKAQSGGALKILDVSLVNFQKLVVGTFLSNDVTFSGGAIYADESSTTVTDIQYTHTLASNVLGSCFMQFPSTLEIPEAMLLFQNNSALVSGNHFHIYNLRSCRELYFLPHQFAQFLAPIFYNPVVIDTNRPLDVTSTGPSYLYFYGASCKCYKPIGDVKYMLPNCSHDLLMDNFRYLPELNCALNTFTSELSAESSIGAQIHPTPDKFLLPWSGIQSSWLQPVGILRATCLEPVPGALIISPAPGEQFDITIQLADQLLNFITGTVYIEISHETEVPPDTLLQLNGIQYAYTDRVYFTPNRALSGLAIVGLPGTEGVLNVVSSSQILGKNIIMQVPFILSQCPLGYYDPPGASSLVEVGDLISSVYTTTQRIPVDQPLACQCYLNSNVDFGASANFYGGQCISGYTIELNSLLWAGIIPSEGDETTESLLNTDCYASDNSSSLINDRFTSWIEAARVNRSRQYGNNGDPDANPVDVVPYNGQIIPGGGARVMCYNYTVAELAEYRASGEFSVDACTRGFCQGNSQDKWYVSDINYPCIKNRQGPLCGQCKEGLALTLTSSECKDCSSSRWYIPLLTTLIFGLLLVILAVAFNFGVSPTLDSMLFFTQAVYTIVSGRAGYNSFFILSIFNLDFTFDQCIYSNLTALPRLLLQYVTPIYIICLLLIVLYMTRIKGCSKFLGNHSFLQAMWLLVLLSYLNIANSTFEMIHCRKIGPRNTGQSEFVLVYDASILCWSGIHLPLAILAVLLAVFLIIPFPGYTALAMHFPKLKPITDVYCSCYKDSQRYWVTWDLLRRIIIVILEVFINNFVFRHYSLLLTALFILTVFIWTWPYKHQIDNWFGCFVSIALILFCIVTQPAIYEFVDPHRAVSWTVVGVVVAASFLLIALEIALCFMARRGSKFSKEDVTFKYLKSMLHRFKVYVTRKSDVHVQLIESASFSPTAITYSEYREPLIDSGQYSSETRRSHVRAKNTDGAREQINGDSTCTVTHSVV